MDGSPYTPGAGFQPPVLAGRDDQIHLWQAVVNDVLAVGRVRAVDLVLVGPRGIGKTVTATAMAAHAADLGFEVLAVQAVRGQADLMLSLRQRAERLASQGQSRWQRVKSALDRISTVTAGAAGVSVGVGRHQRPAEGPRYDAGGVAEVLAGLAADGYRAAHRRGGLLITLDELQVAAPADLALLAGILHQLNTQHPDSRIMFVGAGLATTQAVMTAAGVTHPDRLFRFEMLSDHLAHDDAARAIIEPAQRLGVGWHPEAVEKVLDYSGRYPAHLQSFAHAVWQAAPPATVIAPQTVDGAAGAVAETIRRQTIGPRWDSMPAREREYLAALCALGGTARTADVTAVLGVRQSDRSKVRDRLIAAGDIYVPSRGLVRVSMPLVVPFVLSEYEQEREDVHRLEVLPLDQLVAGARRRRALTVRGAHVIDETSDDIDPRRMG